MEYHALIAHFWTDGTFWVAVAVVIFFIFVWKKLSKAVLDILDSRTKAVQASLDEAAQLKQEAEAMLADAKKKQAQADEDAKHILSTARAEAQMLAAEIAASAEASARRREQMALDRIKAAEASALKDVRNLAIDVATSASAAFLHEQNTPEVDARLVDQAIGATSSALRR